MTAASDTVEAVSRRKEASRKNGSKSRGPTTPEGKSRSRLNAMKHGLTARTLVLPGESPELLDARITEFRADLKPANETEDFLVQRAAIASWELERCYRVIAAKLNERVQFGLFDLEEAETDEVEDHGRRLFWDPRGPIALYPHRRSFRVTRISSPDSVEDPLNPARIVNRLEHLAAGCRWLIDCWAELRNLLEDGLKWQAPDRLKAIRMLGRQPMDLLADERVLMIYLACDAMDATGPTSLDDMQTETADIELARIKERVQGRGADRKKPASPEAGKAALLGLIAGAVRRLETMLSVHRQRREFEKAMQMDLLAFDDSAEGELLRRYQLAKDREFHRALNALFKVRKEALALGDDELPVAVGMDGDTESLLAALEASMAAESIPVAGPESLGWVPPADLSLGEAGILPAGWVPPGDAGLAEPAITAVGLVPSGDATFAESVGCAEVPSDPPALQQPLGDRPPGDETNPSPGDETNPSPGDETNPNPAGSPLPAGDWPSLEAYAASLMARQDPSRPYQPMIAQPFRERERRSLA
jgi:hypothetical protein